jgi:hypothetical protein
MILHTYEIDIDAAAYDDDATAIDALIAFARDAGVTFTNVRASDSRDRAFAEYVRFDATDDDVRAYLAFYDADPDDVTLIA